MLRKISSDQHAHPLRGAFSITRIQPSDIFPNDTGDSAFGPLSNIDHAVLKPGLTIKMHEHVNDEIFSYVWKGTCIHSDSAGFEAPIESGKLMLMNAGESFWHEETVKSGEVEMLQIFVRPNGTDLDAAIQFHEKPMDNRIWYEMVGPETSDAPLYVRQEVYILDAHPRAGEKIAVPVYKGLKPFLYVAEGEIIIGDMTLHKQEAVTDLENHLPPLHAVKDSVLVLFFVDMDAEMSMSGTISGLGKAERKNDLL
ncbi:MAG TPA: pirin family protein [Planococcus sp. (in: firmicutes)]|nr:pirin family protein [Planococcus sp. (in: firmicutes)]